MGCGLGLPAPCAPRPSTLGGPAAPAAPENGRIGGGLSAPLILGGEEAPLLPPLPTVFELFSGCFWTLSFSGESAAEYALDSNFFHENLLEKLSPKNRKFRSSRGSETRRKLDSVKCFVGMDCNFFGVFLESIFFRQICC